MNRLVSSPHDYLRPSLWNKQIVLGRFSLHLSLSRHRERRSLLQIRNRVAALRVERGLSRQEFASLLGIHPSTVIALESGSYLPSLSLALHLSAYFGLPVEAIFFSLAEEDTYPA